jgi:hypothetical protein
MATTSKTNEPVLVQINNEVIELKGAELKAWEDERKQYQAQTQMRLDEEEAQKQVRLSAYTKLGLSKEEINAIL